MVRFAMAFACGCVLLVAGSGALHGQNQVTNPGFDTNLAGWSTSATTWDGTLDAGGSPSSGSAKVTLTSPGCLSAILQCVGPATGGALYDFGGQIILPGGQSSTGSGFVEAIWFAGPNCTGAQTGFTMAPIVTATAAWTSSNLAAATAPAGTQSAEIEGEPCRATGTAPFQANFDNFFFRQTPVAAIPTLGGMGLRALAVLLLVAALAILRRKRGAAVAGSGG